MFPFDTTAYDILYSKVSEVLKTEYPQDEQETELEWYKRLLYEFITFLQTQYEPTTDQEKVSPSFLTNQKKTNPTINYNIPNQDLFSENIEKALNILSQDPSFAIYLIGWWLPLMVFPNDWFNIHIEIDNTDTPAHTIKLTNIDIKIDQMISRLSITNINNKSINIMSVSELTNLIADPYIYRIFQSLSYVIYNTHRISAEMISSIRTVTLPVQDIQQNSFKIATFLYKLKNLTKTLFISGIEITTELNNTTQRLSLKKTPIEKKQRTKFNARRLIKITDTNTAEISASLIQTLFVQAFRTFYEYDKNSISPSLFDYLFNDHPLSL